MQHYVQVVGGRALLHFLQALPPSIPNSHLHMQDLDPFCLVRSTWALTSWTSSHSCVLPHPSAEKAAASSQRSKSTVLAERRKNKMNKIIFFNWFKTTSQKICSNEISGQASISGVITWEWKMNISCCTIKKEGRVDKCSKKPPFWTPISAGFQYFRLGSKGRPLPTTADLKKAAGS